MSVDQDEFLSPRYTLPNTLEAKKKEDDFYKKFGQDYYYENGEKVYVLDEVLVSRKKQKKSYSCLLYTSELEFSCIFSSINVPIVCGFLSSLAAKKIFILPSGWQNVA